jgi:TonB family protein
MAEGVMRRTVGLSLIICLAVCWSSVALANPQASSGSAERRAVLASSDNPVPQALAAPVPPYPAEARASAEKAEVTVRVVVDASGSVVEARSNGAGLTASGDELRDLIGGVRVPNVEARVDVSNAFTAAALDAARRWQFEAPAAAPIVFEIRFRFDPQGETVAAVAGSERAIAVERERSAAQAEADRTRALDPDWPPLGLTAGQRPLRVGGAIRPPRQTRHVGPEFPGGIETNSIVSITIGEIVVGTDGRVVAARLLRSHPLFSQAVLDAVRQWEYEPTLLNGVATPVVITFTIGFTGTVN